MELLLIALVTILWPSFCYATGGAGAFVMLSAIVTIAIIGIFLIGLLLGGLLRLKSLWKPLVLSAFLGIGFYIFIAVAGMPFLFSQIPLHMLSSANANLLYMVSIFFILLIWFAFTVLLVRRQVAKGRHKPVD